MARKKFNGKPATYGRDSKHFRKDPTPGELGSSGSKTTPPHRRPARQVTT